MLLESTNAVLHIFGFVIRDDVVSVLPNTPTSCNEAFLITYNIIGPLALHEHLQKLIVYIPLKSNGHPEILAEITTKE